MRDLGPIVLILLSVVDYGRHYLAMCRRVAPQLIGYQPPRGSALPFQQFAKEPLSYTGVAIPLNQDIDNVSIPSAVSHHPRLLALANPTLHKDSTGPEGRSFSYPYSALIVQ